MELSLCSTSENNLKKSLLNANEDDWFYIEVKDRQSITQGSMYIGNLIGNLYNVHNFVTIKRYCVCSVSNNTIARLSYYLNYTLTISEDTFLLRWYFQSDWTRS